MTRLLRVSTSSICKAPVRPRLRRAIPCPASFAPREADSRRCIGDNAFTSAGEAELFAGRCLHSDALCVEARDPCDVRAHCVAVRRYAWELTDNREIEMRNKATTCPHPIDRENKEPVGRRAAPLRIGWRKMRANIAVGERAEDGIGKCMERNVGIRVPGESSIAGNSDAP